MVQALSFACTCLHQGGGREVIEEGDVKGA